MCWYKTNTAPPHHHTTTPPHHHTTTPHHTTPHHTTLHRRRRHHYTVSALARWCDMQCGLILPHRCSLRCWYETRRGQAVSHCTRRYHINESYSLVPFLIDVRLHHIIPHHTVPHCVNIFSHWSYCTIPPNEIRQDGTTPDFIPHSATPTRRNGMWSYRRTGVMQKKALTLPAMLCRVVSSTTTQHQCWYLVAPRLCAAVVVWCACSDSPIRTASHVTREQDETKSTIRYETRREDTPHASHRVAHGRRQYEARQDNVSQQCEDETTWHRCATSHRTCRIVVVVWCFISSHGVWYKCGV